jgi:hypothetical protein
MGFSFLAPLFLAGLAAVAIPILIHLTHRERKDAIAFPSLMFVKRIPYRTTRRQRIRHWLLFLMRTAAVVLVAAAFARPLLEDVGASAVGDGGAQELVILLDRSHSMGYGDRWERAVSAARRAVDAMGPEDRATLVVFADRAEAITQPTADRTILLAAVDEARLSSRATRYGPALQLAGEIVGRSDRPRPEVLLITDFQKTGWDARQTVKLPEGTTLRYVDLSDEDAVNVAVIAAIVSRDDQVGRGRVAVTAHVANLGDEPLSDVRVTLELDGESVATQMTDVEARGSSRVQFAAVVLPRRTVRGEVRAGADDLSADNAFRFVVAPQDPVSVLMVEPRSAGSDHSLYLLQALAIGSQPRFAVDVRRVSNLTVDDLNDRSLVILNDAPFPAGAVGRRLSDFVEAGGGLLVLLGRRSPPSVWPAEGLALIPGSFGAPIDRAGEGGGTLGYLDYDHPAFQLFREPRSGDFSAARFFRYRRLEIADPARVLARFDDGGVALAEGEYGDGRVFVWASGLENFWNDLTVQPVFLPFAHQLVRHLSGYREPQLWFRVGDVIDLAGVEAFADDALDVGAELVAENPVGDPRVLRLGPESRYFELSEAGFHRIRAASDSEDREFTAAANIEPAESDLAVLDPDELANTVTVTGDVDVRVTEAMVLSPEEREQRQGLWWYLLVGAAGLLILETLISNRAKRSPAA